MIEKRVGTLLKSRLFNKICLNYLAFFKYRFFLFGFSAENNKNNIVPNKKEKVTVNSITSIFILL